MGQAIVVVNGRTYPLQCGDGEEHRLQALADHIRAKVDQLVAEYGQVGDERLLLLAALLTTDELFDLREQRAVDAEAAGQPAASAPPAATAAGHQVAPVPAQPSPPQPNPSHLQAAPVVPQSAATARPAGNAPPAQATSQVAPAAGVVTASGSGNASAA